MEVENRPKALYELLQQVSAGGIDLLCLSASPSEGGRAVVYTGPKDVERVLEYAQMGGIELKEMAGIVIEGEDRIGACAGDIKPLADAGINGVACMAASVEGKYAIVIVVKQEDGDAVASAYGC